MKKKQLFRGALILGAATCSLSAADITWDGGGDGSSWNDALNWNGDVVPGAADNVSNMNGANVVINGGTSASVTKLENGGVTGGILTVNSGGSLTATGSIEVNRKDGANSLLDVNGGTVNNSTGSTFITHFVDATTPLDPTIGTLRVRNGGTYTTNGFRSDGGVSRLEISGAGTVVNATSATVNQSFVNNDAATVHFTMSGGALNTGTEVGRRDFWGGVGSTMNVSGGTYTHNGDQMHLSSRTGGDMSVTVSGGTITSNGNFYTSHGTNSSAVISQTGGLVQTTSVAGADMQFGSGAGSTTEYTISGGELEVSDQLRMNGSGTSTLTVDGVGGTIDINGHLEASSIRATIAFVMASTGVSIIDVDGNLNMNGAMFSIDLAGYDDTNGDVQLFAYTGGLNSGWTEDISGGTGTLDTATSGEVWLRSISVIPEPGTVTLLGLAGLALFGRRRKNG